MVLVERHISLRYIALLANNHPKDIEVQEFDTAFHNGNLLVGKRLYTQRILDHYSSR
jgi:hypothetical protein